MSHGNDLNGDLRLAINNKIWISPQAHNARAVKVFGPSVRRFFDLVEGPCQFCEKALSGIWAALGVPFPSAARFPDRPRIEFKLPIIHPLRPKSGFWHQPRERS